MTTQRAQEGNNMTGLWTVTSGPADEPPESPGPFAIAVFREPVTAGRLHALIGNPLT